MNVRICFIIILKVLLLCGSVLFQNVSGLTAAQIISRQIIATGLSEIKGLKRDFEYDPFKRVLTLRNQLFNDIDKLDFELINSLRYSVFEIEKKKSNLIINILKNTPDFNCGNHLKNNIDNYTYEEARTFYRSCTVNISAEINHIKRVLSDAVYVINPAFNQAEVEMLECLKVYNRTQSLNHLNQLTDCIKQKEAIVKNTASSYGDIYEKFRLEKIVTNLAKCTDETILTLKNTLNEYYDDLEMCLKPSSNDESRQLASAISPKYKLNITSRQAENIAAAIANLKANTPSVRRKLDEVFITLRAPIENLEKLKENKTRWNRILNIEEVNNYRKAYTKASLKLSGGVAEKCVIDGQNNLQKVLYEEDTIYGKCLNEIRNFISKIQPIEKSLNERENKEGIVAIVKCLIDSIRYTNNTVACSKQADLKFIPFLDDIRIKLIEEGHEAYLIETQINKCNSPVNSRILPELAANKDEFQNCLTKLSLDYKLL